MVAWLERGRSSPAESVDVVAEELRQCLKDREADELPFILETHEIELFFPAKV